MGLHEEARTHRRGGTVCPTSVGNPLVHEGEDVKLRLFDRPACTLCHDLLGVLV